MATSGDFQLAIDSVSEKALPQCCPLVQWSPQTGGSINDKLTGEPI